MTVVRRIHPASAFKVGIVIFGTLGLIAGVFCSALSWAAGPAARHAGMPFAVGAFAIVLCPLVWGLIGGIGAMVSALIYNVAARWLGGLQVDAS